VGVGMDLAAPGGATRFVEVDMVVGVRCGRGGWTCVEHVLARVEMFTGVA
jgi:hypothetical protein